MAKGIVLCLGKPSHRASCTTEEFVQTRKLCPMQHYNTPNSPHSSLVQASSFSKYSRSDDRRQQPRSPTAELGNHRKHSAILRQKPRSLKSGLHLSSWGMLTRPVQQWSRLTFVTRLSLMKLLELSGGISGGRG